MARLSKLGKHMALCRISRRFQKKLTEKHGKPEALIRLHRALQCPTIPVWKQDLQQAQSHAIWLWWIATGCFFLLLLPTKMQVQYLISLKHISTTTTAQFSHEKAEWTWKGQVAGTKHWNFWQSLQHDSDCGWSIFQRTGWLGSHHGAGGYPWQHSGKTRRKCDAIIPKQCSSRICLPKYVLKSLEVQNVH